MILMKKARQSQPIPRFLPRLASTYQFLSLQLFSVLLLLALLNAFAYFFLAKPAPEAETNAVFRKYKIDLGAYYPGWDPGDVNALLNETWSRTLVFEPFTQFTEPASRGRFVNVSEHGFRFGKVQGPWPIDPAYLNIFFFGGSTAFGYGVADEDAIPSQLQAMLADKAGKKQVRVYNFGRSHYYSSQERALFAKLLATGAAPDLAIFLDGLNEFYYASDEPLYSDEFRSLTSGKYNRFGSMLYETLRLQPIARPLVGLRDSLRAKTATAPAAPAEFRDDAVVDPVISRYLRNQKLIRGLAASFQVETLFVLQPVPTHGYDLRRHIFSAAGFGRHGHSGYGYEKLLRPGTKHAKDFVSCAAADKRSEWPHYIDIVHYTAGMSNAIAACISERIFR